MALRKCMVRSGEDPKSAKTGMLIKGELIDVLECSGHRLRCVRACVHGGGAGWGGAGPGVRACVRT